jgi:hypothetical protein
VSRSLRLLRNNRNDVTLANDATSAKTGVISYPTVGTARASSPGMTNTTTLQTLQTAIDALRILTAPKLGPQGGSFGALLSDPTIRAHALIVARAGLAHMRATWPAEHAAKLPPAEALDNCTDAQLDAAVRNSMQAALRK